MIYAIRNKVNNKLYIGQTTDKNGFNGRYNYNILKRTHNEHLKRSIEKYGIDNFEIDEEFDIAYSKEELDKLEDMYIKIYNTIDKNCGYNNRYGGTHGKMTEERKQKQSESMRGDKNPFYNERVKLVIKRVVKTMHGYNIEATTMEKRAFEHHVDTFNKHHKLVRSEKKYVRASYTGWLDQSKLNYKIYDSKLNF